MVEIDINLKKEIGTDLGSRQKIKELFEDIDSNTDQVIFNFEGVEFISRTFAQEYLNQKHIAPFEVVEKNMSPDIAKMFSIILKLNNEDCVGKFKIKLIEKCPKRIGFGETAKIIFSKVNAYEEAIIDFESIEFISRTFAQEYVAQKYLSKTKITEVNVADNIEKLLELVTAEYEEYFNVTI